jgi:secretion/DNA translocation related CpaE-like protein
MRSTTGQHPATRSRPRVLLVTADPGLHRAVAAVAAEADVGLDLARAATAAERTWTAAPLVLVGDDLARDVARRGLPRRPGVALVSQAMDDGAVWQRGTALGADQVLMLPDAAGWLAGLLADADAGRDPAPAGPVLAVMAGRGGAGASSLAAALALTATRRGLRSTLVDLDPAGGGLDLLFGLESAPGPRWSDLAGWRDGRLCGRSLRLALPTYGAPGTAQARSGASELGFDPRTAAGLPVLTWPRGPATGEDPPVAAATVRAVLSALAQAGDLVVVDLPRHLDEASTEALAMAAVPLLVVPAEVRAALGAARLAAGVRLVNSDLRVVVRMPSPGGLASCDIADVVDAPLAGVIGTDRRMAEAAEHGEPPGSTPRGTLAGFCRPLLDELVGPGATRHGRAKTPSWRIPAPRPAADAGPLRTVNA